MIEFGPVYETIRPLAASALNESRTGLANQLDKSIAAGQKLRVIGMNDWAPYSELLQKQGHDGTHYDVELVHPFVDPGAFQYYVVMARNLERTHVRPKISCAVDMPNLSQSASQSDV